jgi:hypothetical protein
MKNKDKVIEWMVANEAHALEILDKANDRLIESCPEFSDYTNDQLYSEVRSSIVDEITKSYGIPCDEVYEVLEDGVVEVYLNQILNKPC